MEVAFATPGEQWQYARRMLQDALKILDASKAPAAIGAHVDHAICMLEDATLEMASDQETMERNRQATN